MSSNINKKIDLRANDDMVKNIIDGKHITVDDVKETMKWTIPYMSDKEAETIQFIYNQKYSLFIMQKVLESIKDTTAENMSPDDIMQDLTADMDKDVLYAEIIYAFCELRKKDHISQFLLSETQIADYIRTCLPLSSKEEQSLIRNMFIYDNVMLEDAVCRFAHKQWTYAMQKDCKHKHYYRVVNSNGVSQFVYQTQREIDFYHQESQYELVS